MNDIDSLDTRIDNLENAKRTRDGHLIYKGMEVHNERGEVGYAVKSCGGWYALRQHGRDAWDTLAEGPENCFHHPESLYYWQAAQERLKENWLIAPDGEEG